MPCKVSSSNKRSTVVHKSTLLQIVRAGFSENVSRGTSSGPLRGEPTMIFDTTQGRREREIDR